MRRFIVSGMVVALSSGGWCLAAGPATWPASADFGAKLAAAVVALAVVGVATVLLVVAYDLAIALAQFMRRAVRYCTR